MSWEESSESTWRKELGDAEKIYRFQSRLFHATGREHWGLYTICQVKYGKDLPSEDVEDILADYKLHELPEFIWLPAKSQVVLLVSHWRVDAIGTCMLLNRMFQLLSAKPKSSNAVPEDWSVEKDLAKISPSIEDAAGSPMVSNPEIENAEREMGITRAKVLKSISLPYNRDCTMPGRVAVQATTFTAESSKALIDGCRARGITVAAAIHAALAAATFELSSEKADEYVTVMAVNFRPYLQKPYDSEAHACRTYVTGIVPSVSRNANFEEQTTNLTQFFKSSHTDKMSQALRELYRGAAQAILSPSPRPASSSPSGITHSNLGVVDHLIKPEYHGDNDNDDAPPVIEVTDFRFGVTVLNPQMMLYPRTFRGRLSLSIKYNTAYYDAEAPHKVLDRIQQKLEEELLLKLEIGKMYWAL